VLRRTVKAQENRVVYTGPLGAAAVAVKTVEVFFVGLELSEYFATCHVSDIVYRIDD
jgi:hypothetical protein